jgi:LPS sulfotransferase NodH
VHNWLDTQGFSTGNLGYRNLMSQNPATFRSKLVSRADVLNHLPDRTLMVTAEQRAIMLVERYRAIKLRFGI